MVQHKQPKQKKQASLTTTRNVAASVGSIIHGSGAPSGVLANGSYTIRHREFVDQINVTPGTVLGTWQLIGNSSSIPGYDVNPGNSYLFPWLSSQAKSWERYRFTKLTFHLYPKQGTGSKGWVAMAFDYDCMDAVPQNKRDMLTCQTLVEGSSYLPLSLKVDVGRLSEPTKWRFISNEIEMNPAANRDMRMEVAGFLVVSADGFDQLQSFDLWVEYEVDLSIPRSPEESTEVVFTDLPSIPPVGTDSTRQWFALPIKGWGNLSAQCLYRGIHQVNYLLPGGSAAPPNFQVPSYMTGGGAAIRLQPKLWVQDPSSWVNTGVDLVFESIINKGSNLVDGAPSINVRAVLWDALGQLIDTTQVSSLQGSIELGPSDSGASSLPGYRDAAVIDDRSSTWFTVRSGFTTTLTAYLAGQGVYYIMLLTSRAIAAGQAYMSSRLSSMRVTPHGVQFKV